MVTVPQGKLFQIVYAPVVKQNVKAIDRKHHALIKETIETQLEAEPDVETRNRKPLRRPVTVGAKWEIRFGPHNRFRVFYRVNYDDEQVEILAIGEKEGSRLLIGGEEVEL
ncbi:MAG: type II toxin-antitoxin system RelE/ParE family toxin [Dehalococcoidia bacterium]|nr:type II toxin-antitoxin system RelE/ParE family toxin [Dehalococcoidia bacterium]